MRIALHDTSVHEGSRVSLVAVTDNVTNLLFLSGHLLPFVTGLEASASAAPQIGIHNFLHDFLRSHVKQRLGKRLVAAAGNVFLDMFRINMPAVFQYQTGLFLIERNLLLFLIFNAVLFVEEMTYHISFFDGSLKNSLTVIHGHLRI